MFSICTGDEASHRKYKTQLHRRRDELPAEPWGFAGHARFGADAALAPDLSRRAQPQGTARENNRTARAILEKPDPTGPSFQADRNSPSQRRKDRPAVGPAGARKIPVDIIGF